MKSTIGASIVLTVAMATGCAKTATPGNTPTNTTVFGTQTAGQTQEDSIRSAIQAHLAHQGNLNLQSFDTDLKEVNIQGDHADAQVEFHVKGGPGVMQLTYQLEKRGDSWSVIESVPATSNFPHPQLDGSSSAFGSNGSLAPTDPLSDPMKFFKSASGSKGASTPAPNQ